MGCGWPPGAYDAVVLIETGDSTIVRPLARLAFALAVPNPPSKLISLFFCIRTRVTASFGSSRRPSMSLVLIAIPRSYDSI